MADVRVVQDPVCGLHLGRLRDVATTAASFREHARALGALLSYEALRDLPATTVSVTTPLGPTQARSPGARVVAVAVLRAGLGLLPGLLDLIPAAAVGMVGLERDEATLQPSEYYCKLPPLDGAWVVLLEPMLATGGSAAAALAALPAAAHVSVVSVVATQVAVDRILDAHEGVRVVTAAIDPGLDARGFIDPGLGDFGDRLFGT